MEYTEQTAFDMGISTLQRINFLLYNINNFAHQHNYGEWYRTQRILFLEVAPFIDPKDQNKEKIKLLLKEARLLVSKYQKKLYNFQANAKHLKDVPFTPPVGIEETLYNLDLELRSALKKSGLLMRKGEDATSSML
jgi:hypothetical protein